MKCGKCQLIFVSKRALTNHVINGHRYKIPNANDLQKMLANRRVVMDTYNESLLTLASDENSPHINPDIELYSSDEELEPTVQVEPTFLADVVREPTVRKVAIRPSFFDVEM